MKSGRSGRINSLSPDYALAHPGYLLVNRVFEIDHGQMRIFEGNYDYYLEQIAPAQLAGGA